MEKKETRNQKPENDNCYQGVDKLEPFRYCQQEHNVVTVAAENSFEVLQGVRGIIYDLAVLLISKRLRQMLLSVFT